MARRRLRGVGGCPRLRPARGCAGRTRTRSLRPTGWPRPRWRPGGSGTGCWWTSAAPPPTSSSSPATRCGLRGSTDRERLATGELVYAGLTRTPVMALAAEAPFAGRRVALMNELFATSADLHRLLGALPEAADQHPAADGGPKTAEASARRLARMIGADLADGTSADWHRLAAVLARCLRRRVEDAVALQLSRGLLPDDAPLIGAGCGRFLLRGNRGRPPVSRLRRPGAGRWRRTRLGSGLRSSRRRGASAP